MSTKVLSVYRCCGVEETIEKLKDEYKFLVLRYSNFGVTKRKRTKEELEKEKAIWESTPHLMSGDGYINQIKDREIFVPNPNGLNEYIEAIKKNYNDYDFIIVDYSLDVRKRMEEEKIDFVTIMPEEDLRYEWIGRMYCDGYEYLLKTFVKENRWEQDVVNNVKTNVGKLLIRLKSNETLYTIIKNILLEENYF
jgi:hypothetical protein